MKNDGLIIITFCVGEYVEAHVKNARSRNYSRDKGCLYATRFEVVEACRRVEDWCLRMVVLLLLAAEGVLLVVAKEGSGTGS